MRTIPIYCMPGMAASPKIFEFIDLPDKFEIFCLSWTTPKQDELLSDYAKCMCNKVKHKNPVLLGVSFGGILVQEMAKYISVHQIIIISSILGLLLQFFMQTRTLNYVDEELLLYDIHYLTSIPYNIHKCKQPVKVEVTLNSAHICDRIN